MSLIDPKNRDVAPPVPYTYRPEVSDPNRAPPLTLPSMSSLLNPVAGPEYAQPAPGQRQLQTPYNMVKQTGWEPQANTSVPPTQHLYHPPPPPPSQSYFSQSPTEGVLVSQPQREHHELAMSAYHIQPVAQRRQARKVLMRSEKDGAPEEPKFSSVHSRFYEQVANSAPRQQDPISSTHREAPTSTPQTSSQGQNTRALPVSTLLAEEPKDVSTMRRENIASNISSSTTVRHGPRYTLRMRQEPIAARACGFGERDRRVIDPPPILQMDATDNNASPEELAALLRQPYSVVHCTLWDPQNDRDDTAMPSTTDRRPQRRLMGTLVASPFIGKDEFNVEGCFFPFPDLSVRTPGTYSLRFQLVILNPQQMGPGARSPVQSVVKSAPFNVYNAKDFGGMRASTALTKTLKHQGCLISVKKGNTRASGAHGREDEEEEEDEEEDDQDAASSSMSGGRGKRSKR